MDLTVPIVTIGLTIILIGSNWSINRNNLHLGIVLILFSLYSITHYFAVIRPNPFWTAILFNNLSPFYLMLGPFLYFYVRGVIDDESRFTWTDLLHFIPALIHTVGIWEYLFTPFSYKIDVITLLMRDVSVIDTIPFNRFTGRSFNFILRSVSIFLYVLVCLFMVWREWRSVRSSQLRGPRRDLMFRWLFSLHGALLIINSLYFLFVIQFIPDPTQVNAGIGVNFLTLTGLATALLPIALLVFPQILYGLPRWDPSSFPSMAMKVRGTFAQSRNTATAVIVSDSTAISERPATSSKRSSGNHSKGDVGQSAGTGFLTQSPLEEVDPSKRTSVEELDAAVGSSRRSSATGAALKNGAEVVVDDIFGADIADQDYGKSDRRIPEQEFMESIEDRIQSFMQDEKPFLNPDFRLQHLVIALGIPQHQVYYCLKYQMDTNFSYLRNFHRVEHAKKLIENFDSSTYTLEKIGTDSGFNSRSRFYSSFKEFTGLTPSEYLTTQS